MKGGKKMEDEIIKIEELESKVAPDAGVIWVD
jgi:hypothetical protein